MIDLIVNHDRDIIEDIVLKVIHCCESDRQNRMRKYLVLQRLIRGNIRYKIDGRSRNIRRDRTTIRLKMISIKDDFFKLLFRFDRGSFYELLETIKPKLKGGTLSSELQAIRSFSFPSDIFSTNGS